MSENAIVLLSGGLDSAACVRHHLDRGLSVACVHVDYGQAAARPEAMCASNLANLFQVPLVKVKFSAGAEFGAGEILGRNAFLVTAALMTSKIATGVISLGIHAGTRYYDCTTGFLSTIDRLVAEYTDGRLRVVAPFISWSKKQVFEYYVGAGLPTQLTYSCEAGTDPPCGDCASCQDRRILGCSP